LRRKVARGKSGAQGIVGLLGFFQGIPHCSEQIGADGLMLLPQHGDLPVHIVGIDLVGGWERGLGIVRRISYTASTSRIPSSPDRESGARACSMSAFCDIDRV
jgi:hypothetical protein